MAQRRMFSLTIVDTDQFLDMPQSSQNLYFHLGMRADDDGFVSSPRKILKVIGAAADDLKLLISKEYIIPFESGVCVITDWKQNNFIRSDRYKETTYKTEKSLLSCDENGSYIASFPPAFGIPNDNQAVDSWDTQVRLGKDSIGKDSCMSGAETAPDRPEPPFIEIPLNDGSLFAVYPSDIERWAALYPAVNVEQELRKIAGWNDANKAKRKTARGIKAHINSWLAKEQDRGGSASNAANNRMAPSHQKNYDGEFF